MTSLKLENNSKTQTIDAFKFTDINHLYVNIRSGAFNIGEFSKSNVDFFILKEFEKLHKWRREHSFFSTLWLTKQFKNHPYGIVRAYNFTFIYSQENGKELVLSQITTGYFSECTQWQVGGSFDRFSGHIINDYRLLYYIIRIFRLHS